MALRGSWVWCRTMDQSSIRGTNGEFWESTSSFFEHSFSLPLLFWTFLSPCLTLQGFHTGAQPGFAFLLPFLELGFQSTQRVLFAPYFLPPLPRALPSGCFPSMPPFSVVLFPFYPWQTKILSVISLIYHVNFFPPKPTCWPSLYKVLCWKPFLLWTSKSPSTSPPTFPCSLSFGQILCLEDLVPCFLGLASLLQFSFLSCLCPKVLTANSLIFHIS